MPTSRDKENAPAGIGPGSLSRENNNHEDKEKEKLKQNLDIIKKLYSALLSKVSDEDPERFDIALTGQFTQLVEAYEKGQDFNDLGKKAFSRFVAECENKTRVAVEDRHKKYIVLLDDQHRKRYEELDGEFEREVSKRVKGQEKKNAEALRKEKKELRKRHEVDVNQHIDKLFNEQYRKDLEETGRVIERNLEVRIRKDWDDLRQQKDLELKERWDSYQQHLQDLEEAHRREINGLVNTRVAQIKSDIDIQVEKRVHDTASLIQREADSQVNARIESRITDFQNQLERKNTLDLEARVSESIAGHHASLEAENQQQIREIEAKFASQLETQVQTRSREIQRSLELKAEAEFEERVETKVARLWVDIESDVHQKMAEISAATEAEMRVRIEKEFEEKFAGENLKRMEAEIQHRVAEEKKILEAKMEAELEVKLDNARVDAKMDSANSLQKCDEENQALKVTIKALKDTMQNGDDARDIQISSLRNQLQNAQSESNRHYVNCEEREIQLAEFQKELEAEKAKAPTLKAQIQDLESEATEREAYITRIEQQLKNANIEIDKIKIKLQEAVDEVRDANTAQAEADQKLAANRTDKTAEKSLQSVEAERLRLQKENEDFRAQIISDEAELATIPELKAELSKSHKLCAEYEKQLDFLRDDNRSKGPLGFLKATDAYDDPRGNSGNTLEDDLGAEFGSQLAESDDDDDEAAAEGSFVEAGDTYTDDDDDEEEEEEEEEMQPQVPANLDDCNESDASSDVSEASLISIDLAAPSLSILSPVDPPVGNAPTSGASSGNAAVGAPPSGPSGGGNPLVNAPFSGGNDPVGVNPSVGASSTSLIGAVFNSVPRPLPPPVEPMTVYVDVPTTFSSHNPLTCWLQVEQHTLSLLLRGGKALVGGATHSARRAGGYVRRQFVPSRAPTIPPPTPQNEPVVPLPQVPAPLKANAGPSPSDSNSSVNSTTTSPQNLGPVSLTVSPNGALDPVSPASLPAAPHQGCSFGGPLLAARPGGQPLTPTNVPNHSLGITTMVSQKFINFVVCPAQTYVANPIGNWFNAIATASHNAPPLVLYETLRTIFYMFVHIVFYYFCFVLWDTYWYNGKWIEINSATYAKIQSGVRANRSGQGQSWMYWYLGPWGAGWTEFLLFHLFLGGWGEPISYVMPG